MDYQDYLNFNTGVEGIEMLKGLIITKIENLDNEELVFHTNKGIFHMFHEQDCCETVKLEDIIGDLQDILNLEILLAEERTSEAVEAVDCGLWTFYEIATALGRVTLRWLGESNGYYSMQVSFYKA